VHFLSAAIVGLKRALHVVCPRIQRMRKVRIRAPDCTEIRRVTSIRKPDRAFDSPSQNFRCTLSNPERTLRPSRRPSARPGSFALPVLANRSSPARKPRAPLHPEARVVSNLEAEFLLSGRNGCERCPLRPDSFVDRYVDKRWKPCAWVGMT
jgi:hypothetical protein